MPHHNRRLTVLLVLTLFSALWLAARSGVLAGTGTQASSPGDTQAAVLRGSKQTRQALFSVGTTLDMVRLKVADAWEEPGCNGMVVFLWDDRGVVWAWYDLTEGSMGQHITGEEMQELVSQHLPLETDARTWEIGRGDKGGRPRYYLGHLQDSGEQVWLNLHTETCGLYAARIEITRNGKETEREVNLAAAIREFVGAPHPGHSIEVNRPLGELAVARVEEYTRFRGSRSTTRWYELECQAVSST